MGRKTRAFLAKLGKAIDKTDKLIKEHKAEKAKKKVIKAAVKPKMLTQTPCSMANSTKACPYIPPAKKNTKPNL